MTNLSTQYLGLTLKNPIIASSSGLTNSVKSIKTLEENGIGAVVLKSLFEEQIAHDTGQLILNSDYPEAADYLSHYVKENTVYNYLTLIKELKSEISIPVIASINCYSKGEWIQFAKKIEEAGADAIEINVFMLPNNTEKSADAYEKMYLEIAEALKKIIKIPVAFKIGSHFTNPVAFVNQLYYRKIDGVNLFNRFYNPDIDINKLTISSANIFSQASDISNTLRYTAIISGLVPKMQISASTGVHDTDGLIKLLLAGATTVQLCSVLYKSGPGVIEKMLNELSDWMEEKGFKSIDEFRAKLNYSNIKQPELYERAQFMKYFSSYE